MNTYFCKCGRIVRKSTDADNTGNRDVKGCTGCPYLLPYGEQVYIKGEGFHLKVKGYECRVSQKLEYDSRFCGNVDDKCSCYVASLDYEFLTQIIAWIHETYPDGEIVGNFTPKNIRPTDFSSNGRYREPLYCAQNKRGMAAKAALLERFFNPDGSRKDMTPEEEERKIKDLIENGIRAAQGAAPKPEQTSAPQNKYPEEYPINNECQCVSCTCTGCHEACFGHCQGCGDPTSGCNSYQTGGEKILPAAPASAEADGATEALATMPNALPAFDYRGLDAQERDTLHVAETMIKEARKRFISDVADAVALAHDALCGVVQNLDNSKHGNRGETAFCTWCASMGIKKSTAYNLLQVSSLFSSSSPVERQVLAQAQPSLLYAAAKPSAPAEAVEAVKSGDITSLKEYKDLMAQLNAEKAAREAAEAESRANSALLAEEQRRREKVQQMAIEAGKKREKAEEKAKEALQGKQAAELERDSARSMLKNTQRRAERLEIEHNDTVAHLESIRAELNALRARPIEVAVAEPDPAEIERLATEKAEGIAAQRTALLEAQMRGMQQDLEDLRDSAYQAQASGVDTVFAFAVNAAVTIDTLRSTFLELAKDLQEDDFWSALQPLSDAAWKIADLAADFTGPEERVDGVFDESEVEEA